MTRARFPGRNLHPDVRARIVDLSTSVTPPLTARAVHSMVRAEFGENAVGLSTVEDVVKYARSVDTSAEWTFLGDTTGRARAVLDVIADLTRVSGGRRRYVTVREANLIARIDSVAPAMPPFERWRLARMYIARTAQEDATDDLDDLLTWQPFAGVAERNAYLSAIAEGYANALPAHLQNMAIPVSPPGALADVFNAASTEPDTKAPTPRPSERARKGSK